MLKHHPHRRSGEEKTITIRGVDKNLYEQFIGLTKAWGRNIGFAFSRIISHYTKSHPFAPSLHFILKRFHRPSPSLEVIEGLEDLTITKNDLIEAGDVKYYFKSIKNLIFDEQIDNRTLLRHVSEIRDCQVKMPETVSSLLFHSLVRNPSEYSPITENFKDITIRNVEKDTYDDFVATCHLRKMKIGDAVNELLFRLVPEMEYRHILLHDLKVDPEEVLVVTSLDKLEASAQDLAEIQDRKILFHRIKDLIFAPDVEKEDFIEAVVGIYNCGKVDLPPAVPRLIQISRVKAYPR
ncbi:MAG: hypothetical protein ACXACI_18725 [Candidatus Hodarchaeales archaeon]